MPPRSLPDGPAPTAPRSGPTARGLPASARLFQDAAQRGSDNLGLLVAQQVRKVALNAHFVDRPGLGENLDAAAGCFVPSPPGACCVGVAKGPPPGLHLGDQLAQATLAADE